MVLDCARWCGCFPVFVSGRCKHIQKISDKQMDRKMDSLQSEHFRLPSSCFGASMPKSAVADKRCLRVWSMSESKEPGPERARDGRGAALDSKEDVDWRASASEAAGGPGTSTKKVGGASCAAFSAFLLFCQTWLRFLCWRAAAIRKTNPQF